MARSDNVYQVPSGLPVPKDDGACAHLTGMSLPAVELKATGGSLVDLSSLPGRTVVYCYPRTGRPDEDPPAGWSEIPGARGCTPQSCGFRDHYEEFRQLGISAIFGVSTQDTEYQRELAHALNLPTFEFAGATLIKRLAFVLHDGNIEHVFYPVFPPDSNAAVVIHWLVERTSGHI